MVKILKVVALWGLGYEAGRKLLDGNILLLIPWVALLIFSAKNIYRNPPRWALPIGLFLLVSVVFQSVTLILFVNRGGAHPDNLWKTIFNMVAPLAISATAFILLSFQLRRAKKDQVGVPATAETQKAG